MKICRNILKHLLLTKNKPMTISEMNARKAELIKCILNEINEEESINKLDLFLRGLTQSKAPCQYTYQELITRAEEGIQEYEKGKCISHEDIKRKKD